MHFHTLAHRIREPARRAISRDPPQAWAESCGEPLIGFVRGVRRACRGAAAEAPAVLPQDLAQYLVRVLRCMLRLPEAAGAAPSGGDAGRRAAVAGG